jgi:transcriptional regulator
MYIPEVFRRRDRAAILALASTYPFATVITVADAEPTVSHLPLLVDADTNRLRGHLARENPQYAHFASGVDALVIFHGPHGYVSPSVYEDHPSVPTWNYVVVHVRGSSTLVDELELRRILDDSVKRFDDTGWRIEGGEEFLRPRLGAIAGFEIAIRELEGKWKVSQNRSASEQARVATWLANGDDQSRALAAIMRGSP